MVENSHLSVAAVISIVKIIVGQTMNTKNEHVGRGGIIPVWKLRSMGYLAP